MVSRSDNRTGILNHLGNYCTNQRFVELLEGYLFYHFYTDSTCNSCGWGMVQFILSFFPWTSEPPGFWGRRAFYFQGAGEHWYTGTISFCQRKQKWLWDSKTKYPGIFYFCRSCVFANVLNLFSSCLIRWKSWRCQLEKNVNLQTSLTTNRW